MSRPHTSRSLRGLYAITPPYSPEQPWSLGQWCADCLAGGARLIQYRQKQLPQEIRQQQARELLSICRDFQVPLIINDDPVLAVAIDADGVHLGRDDVTIEKARTLLDPEKIVGVSCYNDIERALAALASGADYVAFGSVFTSSTKPQAATTSLALIGEARRRICLPIIAIGGITPENAPLVAAAGADMVAVISGLTETPEAAARRYTLAFGAPGDYKF